MESTKAKTSVQIISLPYRTEIKPYGDPILLMRYDACKQQPGQGEKQNLVALYDKSNGSKSNASKIACIILNEESKVARVKCIDDLAFLDVKMKIAFVDDRMFTRRKNPHNDRRESAFVEWTIPFVSWKAEIIPNIVIAGYVEIDGYATIDGTSKQDHILRGIKTLQGLYVIEAPLENPIEIMGPAVSPISEIPSKDINKPKY